MSDEKKLRVSAKQRLDLVKKAYYELLTSKAVMADDYSRAALGQFVTDVEEALKNKLDPKDKVK